MFESHDYSPKEIHRLYSVLIILVLSVLFYPFYYFASRKPERMGC